ncbi:MAG: TIGR03668 family PPOX class F420-dependent oxidoreductase [Thaumarchaeota archaeon]|nr:TIGR03668 family PPOX class F420-dependent oxidoreductase [Nitrososphaerota archaeon]
MNAIERYLSGKERGYLATVGKEGKPTVVPICFVMTKGNIYTSIDDKPKSTKRLARIRNIKRNPNVAFLVDSYSDDWRRLSYVLVHANASITKSHKERAMAIQLLLEKYPQYRWLGLRNPLVIRLEIKVWKMWKFRG